MKECEKNIIIVSRILYFYIVISIILFILILPNMSKGQCPTKEEIIRVDLPHWDTWTEGDYFYKKGDIRSIYF